MFHTGSTRMAHNLDRFGRGPSPEELAAEAARLDVQTATVRQYFDWYGGEVVTVRTREGLLSMPAYEFFIRKDVTGTLL